MCIEENHGVVFVWGKGGMSIFSHFIYLLTFNLQRWEAVEKEAGLQLVYNTGGVQFTRKDEMSHVIDAYAKAMAENNIRYFLTLQAIF